MFDETAPLASSSSWKYVAAYKVAQELIYILTHFPNVVVQDSFSFPPCDIGYNCIVYCIIIVLVLLSLTLLFTFR